MEWLIWALVGFVPAVALGVLARRAFRNGSPEAWADFCGLETILDWIMPAVGVMAAQSIVEANVARPLALAGLCILPMAAVEVVRMETGLRYWGCEESIFSRCDRLLLKLTPTFAAGAVFYGIFATSPGSPSLPPSASLFVYLSLVTWVAHRIFLQQESKWPHTGGRWRLLGPCELFSRAAQMASGLGVDLRNVYVVTDATRPFAGGAAYSSSGIVLTTELLEKFSKAEVDAVVRHEIGHLAEKDYWWLYVPVASAGWLLCFALAFLAEPALEIRSAAAGIAAYPVWLTLFLAPRLVMASYVRWSERRATAIAAHEDPRSVISVYWKMMKFDKLPTARPWWYQLTYTHPSCEQQESAIADRHGISGAEIEALHREAESDLAEPKGDRYEPVFLDPSTGEVLEPPKMAAIGPAAALVFMLLGLCPIAAFLMEEPIASRVGTPAALTICSVVSIGVVAAVVVAIRRMRALFHGKFAIRLRAALQEKYPGRIDADAPLVRAAYIWDVGTDGWQGAATVFEQDRLVILGERDEQSIDFSGITRITAWPGKSMIGTCRGATMWYRNQGVQQWLVMSTIEFCRRRCPRHQRTLFALLRSHFGNSEFARRANQLRCGTEQLRRAALALAVLAGQAFLLLALSRLLWLFRYWWLDALFLLYMARHLWLWIAATRAEHDAK